MKINDNVKQLVCSINSTLEEALRCIDHNGKKVAFLTDEDGIMVGLLTDGDIRRLLLDGHGLKEEARLFARKDFKFAKIGDNTEAITQMFDKKILIVPIIDDMGKVVDYAEFNENVHVPVAQPQLNGNEYKYLMDAFLSTWISSTGKYITRFENDFSSYCGAAFGVATSNGTTALHLALEALGIGSGDEVIVPDLTFAATVNAVIYTGATPVIVDVEEDSWCIDPIKVEEAITDRTKAIIPVHLYGQPCDMGKLCSIAKENGLYIVEDCAEAHGAEWDGQKVGTFGIIGCFSFFGNKVITTGEGGMCITNDEKLEKKMRVLRDHGMSKERRYYHEVVGYNYRMTNMQAAIGCAQVERIDSILENRRKLEELYREKLSDTNLSFQINDFPKRKKITWLVSALIDEGDRELFFERMKHYGIDTRSFFVPLSEMDIYKKYAKECKVSHMLSKRGVNFPTSYEINEAVIDKIHKAASEIVKA